MRPLTAKKVIKIITENGFILARQKGSHSIYKHQEFKIIVPIPLHGKNRTIPIGTFLEIIKQSKIPKNKFK